MFSDSELGAELRSQASLFGVGGWEWNLVSGVLRWTHELRAIYGVARDCSLQLDMFMQLIHPDDRSSVMAVMSETLASRRASHEQRFRIVRPDGEVHNILSRTRLECGADGEPIRLFGVNIDLGGDLYLAENGEPTEGTSAAPEFSEKAVSFDGAALVTRWSEPSLAAVADLYRRALHSLPMHVVVLDAAGRILLANQAWEKFARTNGCATPAAVGVGANYLDVCASSIYQSADAEKALIGIRSVLNGSLERFQMEYPCDSPTQSRWFEMLAVPLESGGRGGVLVSHTDVTDRKMAEDGRRENEMKFRAIFDRAAIGIAQISPDGRCGSANARLCETVGHSLESLLAAPAFELVFHPEDRDNARANFEVLRSGASDSCRMEQRVLRPDGVVVWVITTLGCVRNENGGIAYLVAGLEDVSAQKRVEERQQALLHELSHRSKNLFSVMNAIVARSVKVDRPIADSQAVILGRLQALARTYDSLTRVAFDGVLLDVILVEELSVFGERVHFDGPVIKLTDKSTQTFALIAHELATNAVKYGALSVPGGGVDIAWASDQTGAQKRFRFFWRERGGPPARPPTRKGFGTTIIVQIAGSEFACKPRTQYEEDGFAYEFDAPLERVGLMATESPLRKRLVHPVVCSLYETWSRQRPSHGFPQLAGFDWSRFAATGALTIANVSAGGEVVFAQVGRTLVDRFQGDGSAAIEALQEDQGATARAYRQCAERGEPRHEILRMDFGDGDPFTFERLLVPFSSIDRLTATHVAGVVVFEGATDAGGLTSCA